jgi:hypothetical protein
MVDVLKVGTSKIPAELRGLESVNTLDFVAQ